MKKTLIVLILATLAAPLFAGDAAVLPAGVGRLYVVPAYSFWSEAWDDDSERDDSSLGDATSFNIAGALEYGVTPFLSAGLQWIPGFVVSNDFSDSEDVDVTGPSAIEIGAKVQIVGPTGLVPNERIRFSVLPGVGFPLDGYNAEDAADDLAAGDEFAPDGVSNSSIVFGNQTAFDYFITPDFYINLFNEVKFYTPEAFDESNTTLYATWLQADAGLRAGSGGLLSLDEPGEVQPGYDLTLEIEPTYQTMISESVRLSASLAATWDYNPGEEFVDDYEGPTGGEAAAEAVVDALAEETQVITLGPSVAFLVSSLPLPMEFQFDASIPVWGQNAEARNTVLFQWEIYFAF